MLLYSGLIEESLQSYYSSLKIKNHSDPARSMNSFFCIFLRQDVLDFTNVTEVKECRPRKLF